MMSSMHIAFLSRGLMAIVLLGWLTGCATPRYTTNLRRVIERETGKTVTNIPAYRCTAGAHRGASVDQVENTVAALITAEKDPRFAFIEFDIQYTRDKQIVVFHDQRLLRMYGKIASIGGMDYTDLLDLSGNEIALYRDSMDLLHKKLNIEIKSQGDEGEDAELADELIADLRARGREHDVMISSISSDVIRYIKSRYPWMPTGQIYWLTSSTYVHWDVLTKRLYEKLMETQADYILLHVSNLRNIGDLLTLKPRGKTIIFWDFQDGIFLVHKDGGDRLWGASALANAWEQLWYRP